MSRAGDVVARTLQMLRDMVRPGHHDRGPRRRGGEVHPQPQGRQAVLQGPLRLPQDPLRVDRRGDRARHPVDQAGARRGQHRQHRLRRVPRGTARRLGHDRGGGRDLARGPAAHGRDPAEPGGGHSSGASSAITSATSATRCSRWPKGQGTAWCANWWVTASARGSTRSRRCRTTVRRSAASGWWPGMTIAIEPMITAGAPQTRTLSDKWTVVTADGSLAAHFEHTVAITKDGPRILTRAA